MHLTFAVLVDSASMKKQPTPMSISGVGWIGRASSAAPIEAAFSLAAPLKCVSRALSKINLTCLESVFVPVVISVLSWSHEFAPAKCLVLPWQHLLTCYMEHLEWDHEVHTLKPVIKELIRTQVCLADIKLLVQKIYVVNFSSAKAGRGQAYRIYLSDGEKAIQGHHIRSLSSTWAFQLTPDFTSYSSRRDTPFHHHW